MAINSKHPLYDAHIHEWIRMRDCMAGEAVVKSKDELYLPATPGQILDGMNVGQVGRKNYDAYKTRAVFHDYTSEAVNSYIGLLHQSDATIEVPDKMLPMMDKLTNLGENVQMLLRRVNEQQLTTGRVGLLVDLPTNPDPANPLPYITMYFGESIINWDDSDDEVGENKLQLVVLNESAFERADDLVWREIEKYRVLTMDTPFIATVDNEGDAISADEPAAELPEPTPAQEGAQESQEKVYLSGLYYVRDGLEIRKDLMIAPMLRGVTLDQIPFFFVNSKDVVSSPDKPPLLGLADLCFTMYRGEADYRHALFMQGQDTLVIIGGITEGADPSDTSVRVGSGARIDVNLNGDAKYIGTNSAGLPEMRSALENDKSRAMAKATILASSNSKNGGGEQRASGDALRIRMAAQTATLNSIALAGGFALEQALKAIAKWMGEDATKVKVTPNTQFADFAIDGKEYTDLMTARTMGAPISLESVHSIMSERGLTKMAFQEEMDLIEEEDAGRVSSMKKLGLDPQGQLLPPPPPPPAPIVQSPAPKPGNATANA